MKMKLIVLLTLCLSLFVVSVQAQNNVLGSMEDIDVIMTGNIAETITCDITGNAVIVEEMEFTDNMSDDAGNMTNMTNATNNTNISENMTLDVTGKIILIKDLGNMTEKAVMIGRVESIPGNVVIFGKTDNMTEGMANATGNTTGNMTSATGNMTNVSNNTNIAGNISIITTGNMTGTIMFHTAEGADNATGMNNMTENMDNMTVLMAGNMTGNVTGEMTRRMVVIKNISDVTEMSEKIGNVTEMGMGMSNMTEPMELNLTGNMVIIKNMDDMPEMDEEDIDDLIAMDGSTAIIGTMDNLTEMEEDTEGMDNVTKKIVAVRSVDDMIRIVTWDVICNITQSMVTIEDIGGMVENMTNVTAGNMTNMTGNVTGNVTGNMTNMTGNVTGNQTGNVTDNMTDNITGETVEVSIEDFAFDPESVTISTGDTVRWTNMDSDEHTVTDSTLDSGTLEEGDTYEFTFTEPGTFEYYCSIHPEMEGTVTVTDGDMTDNMTDEMVEDDTVDEDEEPTDDEDEDTTA